MRNKVLVLSWGLLFLVVGLIACGGGGGQTNPGPNEISGTAFVADTGAPLFQVSLTMFGSGSGVTFTDPNGFYSFSGLGNGTYNLVPALTGYTFLPPEAIVTVNGQGVITQDFMAYLVPTPKPGSAVEGEGPALSAGAAALPPPR